MKKMFLPLALLLLAAGLCFSGRIGAAEQKNAQRKRIIPDETGISNGAKKNIGKANYTFCNKKYLYVQRGAYLQQCTLDGRLVDKWKICPGISPRKWNLCYVSQQEVFYYRKKKKTRELWSIPIGKGKKGSRLKPKRARKILTGKKGSFDSMYADNRYLFYTCSGVSEGMRCMEYDRQAQKHIPIDGSSDAVYVTLNEMQQDADKWMNYAGMTGVILGRYYTDPKDEFGWDDMAVGIYYHQIGSGTVTKIGENYNSSEGLMIACSDQNIYYTGVCLTEKDKNHDRQNYDIYVCDPKTGKSRVLIAEKDWNQFLSKRNRMKKNVLYGMYFDEGILYLLAESRKEYTEAISCHLQGKPRMVYEKKLNRFLGRYFVQDIVEGKFLCFNLSDDEYQDPLDDVLYDKRTNRSAVMHKKDRRRYYWNYNCYSTEWI